MALATGSEWPPEGAWTSHDSGGDFARELIEVGRQAGLRIDEQDDRLLSYPVLIRVQPGDQSVRIDKARERRLRPSVLVAHLKDL